MEAGIDYRLLGQTGIRVSTVGLGTYNFGTHTEAGEARRILDVALDAGCNLIDTANSYGRGASESMLGEILAEHRDDVILCTKAYNRMGPGPNDAGTSVLALRKELDRSLRRLRTDRIDIYFLHRHDPDVPLEAVVSALDRFVAAGKILYYGFSTFPTSRSLAHDAGVGVVRSWKIAEAIAHADRYGRARVACEQLPYNLIEREVEAHLLPACQEFEIGSIGYSPLAMGALTTQSATGALAKRFDAWFESSEAEWDPMRQARARLVELADEAGMVLEDLAMAWAARPGGGLDSVLIGPRTVEHAARALDVPRLDADLLAAVDRIVPPGTSLWMRPSEAVYRRHAREAEGSGR